MRFFFADANPEAVHFSIQRKQCFKIPLASKPYFVRDIIELTKKLELDLLVPTVDEELLQLAEARKAIGCEILLPPSDFISLHLDKMASNKSLIKAGLPAPKTTLLSNNQKHFPCILKLRTGRGSRNVHVVSSLDELEAHILLAGVEREKFIIQELVQGQEYTVMVVANSEKKLRAIVPVLVSIKKGITIEAQTVNDKKIINACESIHNANPVPGYYNIQLIKEFDGTVKPFEINPRVSTTACLGLAAGIDFISIALEKERPFRTSNNQLIPFIEELKLKRFWHNHIYQ